MTYVDDYARNELYCLVCEELIIDMMDVEVVETKDGAKCICGDVLGEPPRRPGARR